MFRFSVGFFHNYLMQEVTNFVDTFGKHINQVISGSIMASLFRDVVYMCDGLSILHCNIYHLVHPIMVSGVNHMMIGYWSVVADTFNEQLNSSLFWMKSVYSQNGFKLKSKDTFLLYRNESSEGNALLPSYLMEVPILARVVNDFVSTFNELRFVAIKGEAKSIVSGLTECLTNMARGIVKAKELVAQVREEGGFEE